MKETEKKDVLIKRFMFINFKKRHTICDRYCYYIPGKDEWETLGVILLILLAGVNHCQPI